MISSCSIVIILLSLTSHGVYGFIEGLYCGKIDCYSVLGLTREATKHEISKTYRQLAKKHHPDMHKSADAKRKASDKFTTIATAYEVLKDEESRKDYDYMLDHPDEVYGHYYRYYRRSYAPKVDARIVVAVTITVISILQYFCAWNRYKSAIDHLITVPKYRIKAIEIAKKEKLFDQSKKRDRRPKEVIKEEEDTVLKKILEEKMDIRGGYSKPTVFDILWIQLVCLPYTIVKYACWNIWWIWKFTICKNEYGEVEKYYLIKKHLKCSQTQWEAIPAEEKSEYLQNELWITENFNVPRLLIGSSESGPRCNIPSDKHPQLSSFGNRTRNCSCRFIRPIEREIPGSYSFNVAWNRSKYVRPNDTEKYDL